MKIIFDKEPYKLIVQYKPNLKLIDLLKRTLWGTKETLYQHQYTEQNIQKVPNPIFFNLEKNDELIGTCCFSKRISTINKSTYNVWYSRYFSINLKYQGGIFGNMILKHIRTYFDNQTQTPSLFYAYIDASNVRSDKLLRFIGLKKIRSFETLTFSRLYPKKDTRVSVISTEDKHTMLGLLKNAYSDYVFADFEIDFLDENYFILKNKNEIVAGIRVHRAHWIIRSLAGLSGRLIIKILPHIPILSRLFNPKNFYFLAFDGIYSKVGYEKELFSLMESACNSLNTSTGILWLDSESVLYHRIKKSGSWGIMDKLKNNIPANVVAAFKNISQEEQNQISSRPAYISAVDII